jgi:putative chitinase
MPATYNWPELLKTLAPKALPAAQEAFQTLPTIFCDFDIALPLEQVYYIGLALEETGGFTRLDENMRYSAKGLRSTFSKYFPTDEIAAKFAYNEEAIANRVYGTRMGNKAPGDGWKYHGRGPFQLTGRANYASMGRRCQLPLETQPELVNAPRYMFVVASQFWRMAGLSKFALADDLRSFTKIVNGGYIGMEARLVWLNKTKQAVGLA